jgi:hypothetical protein
LPRRIVDHISAPFLSDFPPRKNSAYAIGRERVVQHVVCFGAAVHPTRLSATAEAFEARQHRFRRRHRPGVVVGPIVADIWRTGHRLVIGIR